MCIEDVGKDLAQDAKYLDLGGDFKCQLGQILVATHTNPPSIYKTYIFPRVCVCVCVCVWRK